MVKTCEFIGGPFNRRRINSVVNLLPKVLYMPADTTNPEAGDVPYDLDQIWEQPRAIDDTVHPPLPPEQKTRLWALYLVRESTRPKNWIDEDNPAHLSLIR